MVLNHWLNQSFFRTRNFSLSDSKERLGAGLWVIGNVGSGTQGGRDTSSQSEARADTASTNQRAYCGTAWKLELVSVCVGYGQSQELEVG